MTDAGYNMVLACYKLEGDGFLAPICFDIIEDLRLHGERITGRHPGHEQRAPLTMEISYELEPGDAVRRAVLFNETISKAESAFDKLDYDIRKKLDVQMRVMRAARLFGYSFIAVIPIGA